MLTAIIECFNPGYDIFLFQCGERATVHGVVLVVAVRVARPEVDVPGVVLTVLRAGPVIRRGSCVRCFVPNYATDTSARSGTPIQKRNNHS